MTATSSDVIRFKARVPEFRALPDPDIAAALDEADMWLDETMWEPLDFQWARQWLAAHFLKLVQSYADATGGADTGSQASQVGTFVRSISFGERRVMFGERKFTSTKAGSGVAGAGEELLEDTIYGLKYLMLRARNIPGVLTV